MYKRILVPLDGSALAETVLTCVGEIAVRFGPEVIFLHVCHSEDSDQFTQHKVYLERLVEKTVSRIQNSMNPDIRGIGFGRKMLTGYPAEEIVQYAADIDADLIIMATHGKSGIKRWLLGSVADKVVHASTVPVWLIQAGLAEEEVCEGWPGGTLIVPLDGSKPAEAVLPHLRGLATHMDAQSSGIVLLKVVQDLQVTADYPEAIMELSWQEHVVQLRDHFKEHARLYLKGIQQNLAETGLSVETEVLMGNPADEIINYAQKSRNNMVVMATHGHSGMGRWLTGSVADKVLHGTNGPIMLIRP